MAELAVLFAEVPAFVSVGASHWKLGRRGVDFGGVVEREERLLSPGVPRLLLEPGSRVRVPQHETPADGVGRAGSILMSRLGGDDDLRATALIAPHT
jgi:hypothetical protein